MENTKKKSSKLIRETEKLRILRDKDNSFFSAEILSENIQRSMITETPKKLFGPLWHEGEMAILFGDTSAGKSILAMQLADALANGHNSILSLPINCDTKKVVYLDFELSAKQRELRYTNKDKSKFHDFGSNLIISEINKPIIPEGWSFEEYFIDMLEKLIFTWDVEIVIIDNITFISNDLQKGNKALELMKLLKALLKNMSVSIMLLAHVPKRDDVLPITKNDLSGSKNIANFADSIIALGVCLHGSNTRYIKQIKERTVERSYGAENIIMCEIVKNEAFLGFEFKRFDTELNMLLNKKNADLHNRRIQVRRLHNEGNSYRKIAEIVGVSYSQVAKDLKKAD